MTDDPKNTGNTSTGSSNTENQGNNASQTPKREVKVTELVANDGILKGNLKGKAKIIIGTGGVVEGDIEGLQADIMGHVKGTIRVQELLYLHGTTKVNGDIYAGKLQIEPTAVFNGKCNMGANVVELNNGMANVVNQ